MDNGPSVVNMRDFSEPWPSATAYRNAQNEPVIEFYEDGDAEAHPITQRAALNLAHHLRLSCGIQTIEEARLELLATIQARENQGLRLEAVYWRLCYQAQSYARYSERNKAATLFAEAADELHKMQTIIDDIRPY